MSENTTKYLPLYRKYRPQILSEVVGQGHIKKALANAISLNKISHAYLFTGPRGTGKTSTARIFAKSLNCKEGPTTEPCGKCPSCQDILNSVPIDVIEIDAASNRSVEDAQNVLDKIQYAPVNGKYKIYIIDEVHMLTKHAFNALLKTLEEPPANVIFILATTEPHKVLETITSRCQRFDFRRITTEDIVAHLKSISKKEDIKIDDEALSTIAKSAAGGMRDSLALLDQVSVLDSTKTITTDDVNSLLGRLSFDVLFDLTDKIIASRAQDAIEALENIYSAGNEPTQIMTNLLTYFKNMLIVKNCEKSELLIDLTQLNEAHLKSLKTQVENIDTHQIVFLIERTAYYIKELKATNTQHLWLEISMIDLANLAQNTSLLALQERLERLESGAPQMARPAIAQALPKPPTVTVAKPAPAIKPAVEEKQVESRPEPIKQAPQVQQEQKESVDEPVIAQAQEQEFSPMPKAEPRPSSSPVANLWGELLSNISSAPTRALLSGHARPVEISAENVIITCEKELFLKAISNDAKKKLITEALIKMFGACSPEILVRAPLPTDAVIDIQVEVEKKNPITPQVDSKPSPKKQQPQSAEEEEELKDAVAQKKQTAPSPVIRDEKLMRSDQVNMVMHLFDGKYIE